MRGALRLVGACFLIAAFLWMFFLVQTWYTQVNFNTGFVTGVLSCQESA